MNHLPGGRPWRYDTERMDLLAISINSTTKTTKGKNQKNKH